MTPNIIDIVFLILKILGIFAALLIGAIIIIPRILHAQRLWKARVALKVLLPRHFLVHQP
ncbi:MAG: hypothetical protein ACRD97_08515 [Nitrososphaeraceae archaeon]